MNHTLVSSTSAFARLGVARAWLEQQRLRGCAVRVVAASRGAADDLVRSVPHGAFGVVRSSFGQLAHELAAPVLACEGRTAIAGLGEVALSARAVAEVGALSFFGPIADLPGFPAALDRTLRELRLAAVKPAELGVGDGGAADLARLLATYESVLGHAQAADFAKVLEAAAGAKLSGDALLLLDVPLRSRREADLVAAWVADGRSTLATVPAGDGESLLALSRVLGCEAMVVADDAEGRLGRLRRRLFAVGGTREPELAADGRVVVFSAAGEARECGEVAVRVRELAAAGIRFDQIAVLLRDPSYLSLVDEAFGRADIPIAATQEARRPDPAGRALLALLACADEGLSASRFAEYLSLGQVPAVDGAGAPSMRELPWVEPKGEQLALASLEVVATPVDEEEPAEESDDGEERVVGGSLRAPRNWERLLVDAAVLGGSDRWRRRLAGLRAELILRRRGLEEDEARVLGLDARIAELDRLAAFALPLIEDLATFPSRATWGTWLELVDRLAARALRRAEGVRSVLGELAPMAAVGPVDLAEVLRVLTPRLTSLRPQPSDVRYGKVFVALVDEVRGRSFHTVFLPGLAEGIFPRRALEDPLLLDESRRALPGMATAAERTERERLLLWLAVGAACDSLVISWSRVDGRQGRSRTPSFYALDVARAATGTLAPLDQLQAEASREAGARLGWPAPRDPRRAVDNGEFDLAVVAQLRGAQAGGEAAAPRRGAGNYLLEVEPALARSISRRGWRWMRDLTDCDGLVAHPTTLHRPADPALASLLADQRLQARAYSPTALQRYAACPYQFYLHAIVRLRPRDEAVALETLDPLTRGSLYHAVQFETLSRLRRGGDLPLSPSRVDFYLELLDGALDQVVRSEEDRLAPAIPQVWQAEIAELRTDLRGWLRALTEANDWLPQHFELGFGLGPADPAHRDSASSPDPVELPGGWLVRGAIDLVERRGADLRVTDHKTGRVAARSGAVVGQGEILQPTLYAEVAQALLGRQVTSGRLWYATRRGGYTSHEVPFDDHARDHLREVFEVVDRAVAEPFFPALPRKDACRWCDYRLVCGPDEERRARIKGTSRRHPGEGDLAALRELP